MVDLITENIATWTGAEIPKTNGGRGRGRGPNGQSPHGIKKLRELILELAVRGKLVPQDPNDEPASVLLEKISKEKARLVKEGKIKKQKPVPEIGEDEIPFELPDGWEWERFPNVCIYKPGKTPSTKNPVYWSDYGGDIPWVSISDMEHFGVVTDTNKKITQSAVEQVFKHDIIPSGSLLMSFKLTVGKISILDIDAYHNEAILSIQPFTGINRDYLFKFLPTRALAGNTKKAIMGNTLNADSLSLLLIPTPPAEEQHRIVDKVDELMALCDKLEQQQADSNETHQTLVTTLLSTLATSAEPVDFAQAWQRVAAHFNTLFTTEESIDQLKQTILQLAVMGKLVEHDPNDEPASILLEKIAKEKARLIKEGKIKTQKPLPEISEDEKPFDLPCGWEWAQCQDICYKITDGEHATPSRSDSGYYLLSARNVTNEGIVLNDVDFVPSDEFERIRQRCDPNIGDILISCSGSVGRVALVDKDNSYSMVRSAAMIRPDNKLLSKEYLALALRSPYMQKQMVNRSRKSAQANLFLGAISQLVISIPPLAEQNRIVAKVDELMALCDTLKARLHDAQTTQVQLADVIIEQAVA